MAGKTTLISIAVQNAELANQMVQFCRALIALSDSDQDDLQDNLADIGQKFLPEFGAKADAFNSAAQELANKAAGGAAPESLDDDPAIREKVLKLVAQAVGNQIRPDGVSGAIPYRAVPRFGGKELPAEGSAAVDPELSKIVGIDQ